MLSVRTRRAAMMTLLAPLSALVVGCSAPTTDDRRDDEAAKATEPAAATEQPFVRATADGYYSPDKPPQQPPVPETIHDYTEQSALDFVQYWIDTLNHMWYSGDVSELRRISADGCEACERFIGATETVYSVGEHSEGGGTVVSDYEVMNMDDGWALITGRWSNGTDHRIGRDGQLIDSGPATNTTFTSRLDWTDSLGWRVSTFQTLPPSTT